MTRPTRFAGPLPPEVPPDLEFQPGTGQVACNPKFIHVSLRAQMKSGAAIAVAAPDSLNRLYVSRGNHRRTPTALH